MTLAELENIVRRHMLLADEFIIRLLCAFVIAARLPINPPWFFIVGPPSGGKSALLKSLHNISGVVHIDDLTANTFSSGMRSGKDRKSNSLLEDLLPNTILLFKDFTTIISKDETSRGMIISQMRKIYDGDFKKNYGNGIVVDWSGKPPGVLAGVTEKIYPSMTMFADMGERFLFWDFKQAESIENRKAVNRKAAQELDDAPAAAEMKAAFTEYIESIRIPTQLPAIDKTTENQIVDLAEFVTKARTPVLRKKYSRDEPIIQVYRPEQGPRFVKQILGMALGLRVVSGGQITDKDRRILCKMALDSIPSIRRKCLQTLTRYNLGVNATALADEMRYPKDSIRMHLEDLAAVEVIKRIRVHNRELWKIEEEYKRIMEFHEGIRPLGEALEEDAPVGEEGLIGPELEVVEI